MDAKRVPTLRPNPSKNRSGTILKTRRKMEGKLEPNRSPKGGPVAEAPDPWGAGNMTILLQKLGFRMGGVQIPLGTIFGGQ